MVDPVNAPPQRTAARVEQIAREAPSPRALIRELGLWLDEACGADAHVCLRLDPPSAIWLDVVGRGYDPECCTAFTEKAFLRSPWADYGEAARRGEPVASVTRGVTPRDAYTDNVFDGFGYNDELHATFAARGLAYGHLTLSRKHGRFPASARRLVEAAVAPVTAALRRLHARDMLASVPGEHVALVFVDHQGRLSAGNAAGREMLDRFVAMGDRRNESTLAAVTELARRDLVSPGSAPLPRVLYLEPETGRRYRLTVERVSEGDTAARALVMAEPIRALDSVELLTNAGLTGRESEVALVTLRGFRSSEGADALAMSEHTFLGHLKAVYRKLGVGSRAELACLLLSSA